MGEAEDQLAGVLGQEANVLAQLQLAGQEEEQGRKDWAGAGQLSTSKRQQLEKQLCDQKDMLAASRASEENLDGQLEASDASAREARACLLKAKEAAADRKNHSK